GREDESARIGADEIDKPRRTGDVAADDPEGLAERAFYDVDPVHQALAFGDAAAARAVHADRVDLVQIGERAVLLGYFDDLANRRDVAIHRIDALEGNDLRPVAADLRELPVEIGDVIVLEDAALGPRVANALDHRGMVAGVGEDDAARNMGAQ